ncbi:MAG: 2-hydroxyacyl-CoA dehydratase [Pseudomonadales bacterium]|nr:2-hydroxyacyl-CoA dehydratase [Pseudomonadales bacterium]MCP5302030.1 2-hydroxyacyl-CoA dehydratase [Pseudomonadales bacterium]
MSDVGVKERARDVQSDFDQGIVGRGQREAARLTREWFSSLDKAAREDKKAAYVFVMGSMSEVLRTFDLPIVFPEVTSLQLAVRGMSEELLKKSEDYGYSPDVCGYVKSDVALHLSGGNHPMGRIPQACLSIATNACNTYFKWVEAWERIFDAPTITVDVPSERANGCKSMPQDIDYQFEVDYVAGQIKELIARCEQITGKKFDIDKFREFLAHSNTMNLYYKKVLDLNANTPAVFNHLTDGLAYLGMANCYRGSAEGAQYFKELYEEMSYRVEHGIGAMTRVDGKLVPLEQKFRLGLRGVPCYPIIREFDEMFSKWGGVFVASGYLTWASGGMSRPFEFDLNNPIESFAEGTVRQVREVQGGVIFDMPEIEKRNSRFNLDGVVYHGVKSCRTASSSLADRRFCSTGEKGLPILLIESELVDPRAVSKAQLKNRVDAFFEGLISRQQKEQAV